MEISQRFGETETDRKGGLKSLPCGGQRAALRRRVTLEWKPTEQRQQPGGEHSVRKCSFRPQSSAEGLQRQIRGTQQVAPASAPSASPDGEVLPRIPTHKGTGPVMHPVSGRPRDSCSPESTEQRQQPGGEHSVRKHSAALLSPISRESSPSPCFPPSLSSHVA